jgi:hypothetical protein
MNLTMTPVILESPYAGTIALNLTYLRACMRDSLLRGEAPFASHGLYTQMGVLRDEVPEEREHGIQAGFAWRALARFTVFYTNLGWSNGMERALAVVQRDNLKYEVRTLPSDWLAAQVRRERERSL